MTAFVATKPAGSSCILGFTRILYTLDRQGVFTAKSSREITPAYSDL